jgi:hypothetical protein
MGLHPSPHGHKDLAMGGTARRAATATLVGLAIVAAALALWKIKAVIASTLVDVVFRGTDPAEEDVPPLLFPAKDAEAR